MALITGSAFGTKIASEELYIEGAPQLYFGDVLVPYGFGPDSDGFYWQLTGTAALPVYQLGCYEGVTFGDNQSVNAIRCDVVGDKDVVIKREHMELKFTLKSFLPFTVLSPMLGGGPVTTNASQHTQKFGLGVIDNSKYYKIYLPKVYDETAGDYVAITGHRCKFVSGGDWSMSYGNVWSCPIAIWLLADESKPAAQQFATVIRSDLSVLV